MTTDSWRAVLRDHREQKDRFLARDHQSPIPHDQREFFDGLDYFEPNPDLRFELELQEYDDPETIVIATNTEGEREYLVWGYFEFDVAGDTHRLDAYRTDPDDEQLWIPFRDETSTHETYGAGRYLDLGGPNERGLWELDFNYAYSPFCAYSPMYECPLVPLENWLRVRVEAGEKDYEGPPGADESHPGHGHAD